MQAVLALSIFIASLVHTSERAAQSESQEERLGFGRKVLILGRVCGLWRVRRVLLFIFLATATCTN
jgi:hypothetical protein